jgi:hypothetical protein
VDYETRFGKLADYTKGGVEIIDDSAKNYVFSNIFEVASTSPPYERVAVAKNFEYVIEVARAEGTSPWFTCAHDEFAVSMDGQVEVHLMRPDQPLLDPEALGAHRVDELPDGRKMGRIVLGAGHQGLLPAGSVYRFHADAPACLMIQTIEGPVTVQKWAQICQTDETTEK